MDFNDIKNIWKNSFKNEAHLSKEQIEKRLKIRGKSNSALRKIRRGYRFDIYCGAAIFIAILVGMTVLIKSDIKYYLIAFALVFFTAIIWFAWVNFNKIRKTIIQSDMLKQTLTQTIRDIEKYVKFNRGYLTKFIIIPFSLLFGMLMGLSYAAGVKDITLIELIINLKTKSIIVMSSVLVFGSAFMIPFALYVNKKLYKNHLDDLKQYLKEFKETEDENKPE